ncbi:hypothetical protein H696_01488 [Fonticula alba]|uniref:Uncharacterized protein n=1 Tax=Fonticula alba TaxID=691883 RepID=A0A058ZCE3_FONAL|nr:hypothetical protein H696_01488 [Fonticula alba]KCV72080.1 hypothetical protein H696_01488 [Fonticula alba]|eukprot:XP_009493658.1 hypothetical protein H696_01488 [Fonticula alba]
MLHRSGLLTARLPLAAAGQARPRPSMLPRRVPAGGVAPLPLAAGPVFGEFGGAHAGGVLVRRHLSLSPWSGGKKPPTPTSAPTPGQLGPKPGPLGRLSWFLASGAGKLVLGSGKKVGSMAYGLASRLVKGTLIGVGLFLVANWWFNKALERKKQELYDQYVPEFIKNMPGMRVPSDGQSPVQSQPQSQDL